MRILNKIALILPLLLATTGCFASCSNDDEQLRRDIGEMLLIGFRGQRVDDCPHLRRDLQQYHVGSVILFEYDAPSHRRHRNIASPAQLKALCSQLQSMAGDSLLIGIDQEGGKVCRLRTADKFPFTPSARHTALAGYDSVRAAAALTARMLREAGVNFDFAPVADVDVNPDCPVIGKLERSFSADTDVVARCCRIWLDELRREGVLGCMKHFPGHGSATGDTHAGLVDVSATWQSCELAPYRALFVETAVPAVMVAHVVNSKIDSEWPASLSRRTVTDLLRDSLGFQGVIVTDDLAMGAIINQYDYETVVYRAIEAGSDLLCLSNNGTNGYNPDIVPQTVEIILQLVADGRLSAERIHASAERVRTLKRSLAQ